MLAYNLTRIFSKKLKSLLSISRRVQLWDKASALFPNTIDEAKFISNVTKNNFVKVVPNGLDLYEMTDVSKDLFETEYPFLKNRKFVLNVARVERRKNQKLLVQACKELDMPVVVVGKIWDKSTMKRFLILDIRSAIFLGQFIIGSYCLVHTNRVLFLHYLQH